MALFPFNVQTLSSQGGFQRLQLAAGAVVLAALLGACGKGEQASGNGGPGKMGAMPPMPVTVIEAKSEHVPALIESIGQMEGAKDVDIHPQVSGILKQQRFKEGDQVKAGAVLFTIDRAPFEIALAQAKGSVAQDKASLEQARREVTRLTPLVAERAVNSKLLDDANTTVQTVQAMLQVDEAKVRDAELNLSYTAVTAPISGVTDRAQYSVGTLVVAGGQSTPLTTMHIIDPIRVRFTFSESEALQLRSAKGSREVTLILADGSSYGSTGKIDFTASTVDTRSGMVEMRAQFPNPAHLLLPGQFVRVQVSLGERDAYLIPQAAVAQTDKGSMLFTVAADNSVAPRPVETDGWFGENWVVTKGLNPGDRVIIDNLMKLRPGASVVPHAPGVMPAMPQGGPKP